MFEWGEIKRKKVLQKHGVDFDKIRNIFDDPYSIDFIDAEHSTDNEIRFIIIAKTAEYGLVFLSYREFDDSTTIFITARRAEKWMVGDYEKYKG